MAKKILNESKINVFDEIKAIDFAHCILNRDDVLYIGNFDKIKDLLPEIFQDLDDDTWYIVKGIGDATVEYGYDDENEEDVNVRELTYTLKKLNVGGGVDVPARFIDHYFARTASEGIVFFCYPTK